MQETITNRQLEIIEAAGKILTSSGINGLTIKNLAKQMQFSESALYRHFSSKEEIIVTMLNYLADNITQRFSKVIIPTATPKENFMAFIKSQVDFFNDRPYFVVAVFSDGLLEESLQINIALDRIVKVLSKHIFPLIEQGQQQGYFTNEVKAEDLLHIIMGAFRLQMLKWRLAQFEFDIYTRSEQLAHSLLTIISQQK